MAEALARLFSILIVGVLGYWMPIRLGLREARARGVSPHWLWFGIYPFVAWAVWAIVRRRPMLKACPSCGHRIGAGDRFCPGCRSEVPPEVGSASSRIIKWSSASITCSKCNAQVRLTDPICTKCGTPTPSVGCPKCRSPRTALLSRRTALIVSGIVILCLGSIPVNRVSEQAKYRYFTYGEVIEFLAGLLVTAAGAIAIYQAFTWRAYQVNCQDCGKKSGVGPEPTLHALAE